MSYEYKNRLDELAQRYHGGNRSAQIRAAIEIYDLVIDDRGRPVTEKLFEEINTLQEAVEAIEAHLTSSNESTPSHTEHPPSYTPEPLNNPADAQEETSPNRREVINEITSVLRDNHPAPCDVEEIVRSVDVPSLQVPAVLEYLTDEGIVVRVSEPAEQPSFRLAIEDAFDFEP